MRLGPSSGALAVTLLFGVSSNARADGFSFFRYDDDFSYLADPARRTSWYDDFKYLSLSADPRAYLTLGADVRERVESYDEGYFGLAEAPHTTYLLSRALIEGDLHVDDFRAFVQLGNFVEDGRKPAALPTDDDRGDVQQAFLDFALQLGDGRLTVRTGRFEMKFGEGLIISPRDGPNIRQAWDGARLFYELPELRVDLMAVRPVIDKPGYFDDTSDQRQSLLGVYITSAIQALDPYALDIYYFNNINHDVSFYDGYHAPGSEHTSTSGARWYGHPGQFDSTSEAAIQTGLFNTRQVHAYAVHNELGWTFTVSPWKPRVGLKADVLSGSSDPFAGHVRTFNALYPNYSYGTDAVLEAPSNLIQAGLDVHAYPANPVDVEYTTAGMWRYSTRDAFYAMPLFPLIPGNAGTQRYIGIEQQLACNWRINPYLGFRASLVHYAVGDFVSAAHGRDTNFAMMYLAARF